eukprot:g47868.t1
MDVGEIVNEYFRCNDESQEHVKINKEEVLDVLVGIQVPKSPGHDEMYRTLPWEAKEEIAEDLMEIFNTSLAIDEVPDDWRAANVVPRSRRA